MEWMRVDLDRVIQETELDRSFVLLLPPEREGSFRFRPGQYVHIRVPDADPPLRGVYSVSSSPSDDDLEVTIRGLGEAGSRFAALEAGTPLEITMPRGTLILDDNTEMEEPLEGPRRRVLVAEGAGVAPLRGYLRQLRELGHDGEVALIHSDVSRERLLFHDEFARHADECSWFTYVPMVGEATDPAQEGARGPVDAHVLDQQLRPRRRTVVYAVGASAFVDHVLGIARDLGIPDDNLHRERWG